MIAFNQVIRQEVNLLNMADIGGGINMDLRITTGEGRSAGLVGLTVAIEAV